MCRAKLDSNVNTRRAPTLFLPGVYSGEFIAGSMTVATSAHDWCLLFLLKNHL
jgi:hypothetical protein